MTETARMCIVIYKFKNILDFEDSTQQEKLQLSNPVKEAKDNMVEQIKRDRKGNALSLVTLFLENFPEATYGIVKSPYNCKDNVVAIYQDKVFDVAAAIAHKEEPIARFCNIPLEEYCKKSRCEIKILPNPKENLDLSFGEYFK